ncbi:hypothetical protein FGO68_gene12031 [Halteria grandinella]|uniref:Fatty acid hydroxylase domain-containing protein n=1 Tax=Halteria grandinella TaxID=5974 RepID=A0A8J8NL81_HALGN|nr:hypothetical protein FGO68_gene12031 [Halteria grandinella]
MFFAYFIISFAEYLGHTYWPSVLLWIEENEVERWKFSYFASWGIYIGVIVFANLGFAFIYWLNHPFFEQYKILKTEKWPWKENTIEWKQLLIKSIALVGVNALVIFPCMLYLLQVVSGFNTTQTFAIEDLPSKITILWQYIFASYVDDIGFTLSHRLLHIPFFYKHVHKVHHSYTQAVSISATYAHPVEYALGNMLPAGIPTLLMGKRQHFFTFCVITIVRVIGTSTGHSGYDFPWVFWDVLPMRGTAKYHDYHHSGGDFSGNYSGASTIIDTVWGTNKKYYREYKKEMMDKKND